MSAFKVKVKYLSVYNLIIIYYYIVICVRKAHLYKVGKSLPHHRRGTFMIPSSTQNPTPDQNKQPDTKAGMPQTDAEKKLAADKAAQGGNSKS